MTSFFSIIWLVCYKHTFHVHTVVDCGDLDDPINGQVSLSGTTFESIATYTCDPGFTLTRGVERTCRENGQWSGNEPFCGKL